MRFALVGQALDGGDLAAVVHDGEGQAGIDALAVHQHRAGAALAAVAAFLGAGQVGDFAQGVEQGDARFDVQLVLGAVDAQCQRLGRHVGRRVLHRRRVQGLVVLWHCWSLDSVGSVLLIIAQIKKTRSAPEAIPLGNQRLVETFGREAACSVAEGV